MKMYNSLTKSIGVTLVVLSILFVACKKDNGSSGSNVDQTTFANSTAESDAEAQVVFNDVFDNVVGTNDEVGMTGVGVVGAANNSNNGNIIAGINGSDSLSPCFTITVTRLNPPDKFPVQIVVDFGTGCTGRDGRTRKGKIVTVYTNRLVVPGAKATTTFGGYFVNDIQVEGTHIIENTSTSDKRIFHVQVIGAKLTKANGNYTEWSSDKTIEQTDGLGTPFWPFDDVFTVNGQANGTLHRGTEFMEWSHIITKPIIKKFACRWIVQGEVTIQKGTHPVAILDFGTGECDNKATITVNGVVREITLH